MGFALMAPAKAPSSPGWLLGVSSLIDSKWRPVGF
jgi:hypothetical protein